MASRMRLFGAVLLACALVGCGFHLRGSDLRSSVARAYVDASPRLTYTAPLKLALERAGAEVIDAPASDALVVELLAERRDRRSISVSDSAVAAEYGLQSVLHPHVGTMVEQGPEVERVLAGSSSALCLDTGHLLIGGTDPVALARDAGDRIAHVHAKDVDNRLAARVRSGELTYTEAVAADMYRPIGDGDVDFAAVGDALAKHHYAGWWVLEQDTILTAEPHNEGPKADVRRSADHLRALLLS